MSAIILPDSPYDTRFFNFNFTMFLLILYVLYILNNVEMYYFRNMLVLFEWEGESISYTCI